MINFWWSSNKKDRPLIIFEMRSIRCYHKYISNEIKIAFLLEITKKYSKICCRIYIYIYIYIYLYNESMSYEGGRGKNLSYLYYIFLWQTWFSHHQWGSISDFDDRSRSVTYQRYEYHVLILRIFISRLLQIIFLSYWYEWMSFSDVDILRNWRTL